MATAQPPSPSREASGDFRHQFSGAIANNLIHNEEPDPEQQPLRRATTPQANRERFQQNQRTAAQGVVQGQLQRSGWILLVVMFFVSALLFTWVAFYIQGWNIWKEHGAKKCDQPLADWLLVMLLLPIVALFVECCQCGKNLRFPIIFLTFVAILIGLRMFWKAETCDKSNPALYTFVRQYLIFLTVFCVCVVVLLTVPVAVVIYGMWHGWFDQINGASPETIKHIETVPFDASLFAQDGKLDDGKPAPECCICTETFEGQREIKRTQCQHFFHEDCLGKWLKVSTTCPLCRNDLERATLGENVSSSSSQSAGDSRVSHQAPSMWRGLMMPESASSAHEAQEVQAVLRAFPGLDETTALHGVRQSGSAEQFIAFMDQT